MLGPFYGERHFALSLDARSCGLRASGKNRKNKEKNCELHEYNEKERDSRNVRDVLITRHRNSKDAFDIWKTIPRIWWEERATRERKGGRTKERELLQERSVGVRRRGLREVGSWGDGDRREKEGSSISLIRSPRRPPGFRNAKHLLLLRDRAEYSAYPRRDLLTLPYYNPPSPTNKPPPPPTDCSSLGGPNLEFWSLNLEDKNPRYVRTLRKLWECPPR